MKLKIVGLLAFMVLVACKKEATTEQSEMKEEKVVEVVTEKKSRFPEDLEKVFNAHGTYDAWKSMKTLSYVLDKKGNAEKHLTDLENRKVLITSDAFTIGFDGKEVWVNEGGKFPEDRARFYHNLYFYFYAMPFVLSDSGITYEKVDDLSFEGVNYPGYKISFAGDKGDSPDDNYFLYYHPETHQMQWLGYTVTYGEGKPNNNVNMIRYNDWNTINGIVLPKTIAWYSYEEGKPVEMTNEVSFKEGFVSTEKPDQEQFKK